MDGRFVTGEELVVLFGEQRDVAAGADIHRRVEAGVLAAGTALGRHLVVELVFDLHLVGVADLAEVQGDGDLPDRAWPIWLANAPPLSSCRNSVVSVGLDIEASPGGQCRWAAD